MRFRSCQLILLCLFASLSVSNAQEFVREFGMVTKEDFDFVKYEAEPNAEAVVLFDKGVSYFVEGTSRSFDLFFERHVRIKVLSNAGVRWADFSVPFYRDGVDVEVVKEIEGITYNFENGELTKSVLDPNTAFSEKINDNVSVKKFAMPAVKAGSIIDVKYQVFSPFVFRFNDWKFQSRIPTLYSYYEARLIPFYEYVYVLMGGTQLTLNKSSLSTRKYHFDGIDYNEAIYQFATKNVPSFSDEDFYSSEDDYIQRIDFQLAKITQSSGQTREIITTWPKLVSALDKHAEFGKYVSKSEKEAQEIVIPGLDNLATEEKVKKISEYVKSNYSWNGYYGKYTRKTVNDFVSQKSGSSADINLFLVGLLRANGVEAYPVIISTRGNGRVYRDYPFDHFFNYVIAYVPMEDHNIFIDGTERHSRYNELPQRCINDAGLVIREGEIKWIDIRGNLSSVLTSRMKINVQPQSDSLDFTMSNEALGYKALNLRIESENDEQKAKELFGSEEMSINKLSIANYDTPALPLLVDYEGKVKSEFINSKIFVAPFLNAPPSEGMFKSTTRKYPVDLIYPRKEVYVSEVVIPDGYKFEALPANYKLETPLYFLDYAVDATDPKILKVSATFELKLGMYRPEHYPAIRMGNNKAVNVFNQKITVVPAN